MPITGPTGPVVDLTATPLSISAGNSSNLAWTVSGATSCTASANDGSWNKAISPNNGNEAVSPIVNTQYTLSCTGPGGTTADTVTVTLPSGFIDSTPCTIAASSTSCFSTILWDSYNFLGTTEVTQGATLFSTATTNLGVSTLVTPTTNVFTLTDTGSGVVGVETVSVGCVANTVWVPSLGICAPQPSITIVADPNVIRSGTSATLDVEIDALYDLTCTFRDGGAPATFTHSGAPAVQPQQYTRTTRNLTSAQIVSISCVAVVDPLITGAGEARVNVVPTIQEI
jgi:3D (Asp-Asp-Asp) domain-containing protein